MAMELDAHLLYFTKLSGKSLDFDFLVGTHLKASRRYHGNHQKNNTSIDEAPFEAFNLMHILELSIDDHIKLNKEFFVRYINKIHNKNVITIYTSCALQRLPSPTHHCSRNTKIHIFHRSNHTETLLLFMETASVDQKAAFSCSGTI